MSRLFISHSSRNNAQALAVARWLEENGLGDYFLDIHENNGISAGERWMAALTTAVDRCEAVIFLVSPAWRDSKYCFAEFFKAHELGKRIFGVIVEPIEKSQLPRQMTAEWQVCNLTSSDSPASFEVARQPIVPACTVSFSGSGLATLLNGLRKAGLDPTTFVWPPKDDAIRGPYPGLRALDEPDAAVFFGREALIVRAIDQIRLARERGIEQLFAILGASGAGKSSFLRAGLLPRLRRDNDHFVVLPTLRCERAAMEGPNGLLPTIRAALVSVGIDYSISQVRNKLQTASLADLIRTIESTGAPTLTAEPRGRRTVIIPIDQAEELFASDNRTEAEVLLKHLEVACEEARTSTACEAHNRLRIMLLLTIRADSLTALQRHEAFAQSRAVLFSLPAMPVANFRSVIEGPARRHSETGMPVHIEPGLIEELIRDAQGPDALPLLALTLEWLYREFTTRDGTRIGLPEYQAIGGVRGVINAAVRRAFDHPEQLPVIPAEGEERGRVLSDIFTQIVTIDPDTGQAKRRIASRWSLRSCGPTANGIVDRLIEQRLLSSHTADAREGNTSEVVEVAHEALLRHWDSLAAWLRTASADLTILETLHRASVDWDRGSRDPTLLVHTSHRLRTAESLRTGSQLSARFDQVDEEYLSACAGRDASELQDREERLRKTAKEQEARARIQKLFFSAVALSSLIIAVASVWTIVQRRAISRQTSLVLADASKRVMNDEQFARGVRLAILATKSNFLSPPAATAIAVLIRAADANPLRLLVRQNDQIIFAIFSPDGSRIVTASNDNTARIWDARTGKQIGAAMKHDRAVFSAAFSPDGWRIVTASEDMTARVWNGRTGELIGAAMKHGGAVFSAEFGPNGKYIVTASADKSAHIWDGQTGEPIGAAMNHDGAVFSAKFGPNGKYIVTASADKSAHIWNGQTGEPIGAAMTHDEAVNSAIFSTDGKYIVTASDVGFARMWNGHTGESVGTKMDSIGRPMNSAEFSPDGTRVVTASADKTARIWDVRTGKRLGDDMKHDGSVSSASFSPDGKYIVTASNDGTARIWNGYTGDPLGAAMKHDGAVSSASFSVDGKYIVTASADGTARIWNGYAGDPLGAAMKHDDSVNSAAFSSDGTRIVTTSDDGTARIWDGYTGESLGSAMKHDGTVDSASFSPDGNYIVTASGDDTAHIWDGRTGKPLGAAMKHDGWVRSAAFSPDGKYIVTASYDETARIWDGRTGESLGATMKHDGWVRSAAFSWDGMRIVTTSDLPYATRTGTASDDLAAHIWDRRTCESLGATMKHEGTVNSVAFSPDGTRIVTASQDNTAHIWNGRTGESFGAAIKHDGWVRSAAFSPDGSRIVTASDDFSARIWDGHTGESLGEVMKHKNAVYSAAFSADGKYIVTASADQTARIWDGYSGESFGAPMLHDDSVRSAAFSPDDTRIVTVSRDDTAQVWSTKWIALGASPDNLVAAACGSMNKEARRITQEDRKVALVIPANVDDVCEGIVFDEPK